MHSKVSLINIAYPMGEHFSVTVASSLLFPTPYSGEKFLIRWYRGYLISVSKGGRGGGARGAALASSSGGSTESMTLTIYDIQNQFLGKGVHELPGCLYILVELV